MRPLITPEQMRQVDAAATESLDSIIDRVGALVAIQAIDMMGGTYGRRVVVVAGPGNNGADGRAAAQHLERRGVRCLVMGVDEMTLPHSDLVIDAAFGTGLSRPYNAPLVSEGTPVLSIDIASGHDGLTGKTNGAPFRADRTVVLADLKPGNLFEPARSAGGERCVVDIGLASTELIDPQSYLVEAVDVAAWLPKRRPDTHKWKAACWVIAGSPGMTGAAYLAARGAQRGGASFVRLSSPGVDPADAPASEVVTTAVSPKFDLEDSDRFASMVLGPGLGRHEYPGLLDAIARVDLPIVLDADALWHLGGADVPSLLQRRSAATVLTPHDGEFKRVFGAAPGTDRIESACRAASYCDAVVLLKGATTVIAAPDRPALVMAEGDERLATAGTGDVLAGLIGAFLANGMDAQHAAAAGAFVHAKAASLGPRSGLVAGDLPELIPQVVHQLRQDHPSV